MHIVLVAAQLCATVRSPDELAEVYRAQSRVNLALRDEYDHVVRAYGPFANEVAVLEEFSMSLSGEDAFFVSGVLEARVLAMSETIDRLEYDAARFRWLADTAAFRYSGLRSLRVRAMRSECLAVLSDPG